MLALLVAHTSAVWRGERAVAVDSQGSLGGFGVEAVHSFVRLGFTSPSCIGHSVCSDRLRRAGGGGARSTPRAQAGGMTSTT
jgi:hypothetical protein